MSLSAHPFPAIPMRLQLSRARGFDLQAVSLALNGLPAVNCGRPSILGNPFHGDLKNPRYSRPMFVAMHRTWLEAETAEELGYHGAAAASLNARRAKVMAKLPGLRDKNLACWCDPPIGHRPDECHCRTLIRMANKGAPWLHTLLPSTSTCCGRPRRRRSS